MKIEIDVSGEDLLTKDYTICIADKNDLIKGFKFNEKIIKDLCSRYGQNFYRYKKSKKGKSLFKIRLYCITIYYLINSLNLKKPFSLILYRDFQGKENDIKENLFFFLIKKLNLKLDAIYFKRLSKNSNADKYAFLMREDKKNKLNTYLNIDLKDFEKWLKK